MKKLLVIAALFVFSSCGKVGLVCPPIIEKGIDGTQYWIKTQKYEIKFPVSEAFYNSRNIGDRSCE